MLRLPFRPPYDAASALRALAAHDVPGLQATDLAGGSHARVIRTPSGPVVVTITFGARHVDVRLGQPVDGAAAAKAASGAPSSAPPGPTGGAPAPAASAAPTGAAAGAPAATPSSRLLRGLEPTLRRWLDLDLDPSLVADALGADGVLGPLLRRRPGLRVLGCTDGFEAAMGTVLGQQVSVAAGRTFAGRLVASCGERVAPGFRAFPSPAQVAALTPVELQRRVGVTGARARTLVALAEVFAAGFALGAGTDAEAAQATLLAVPGIGPWTVDILRMRALGERDAFPAGDLVLRRALGVATAAEVAAAAAAWRPFRAYATFHLWTQAVYGGGAARAAVGP